MIYLSSKILRGELEMSTKPDGVTQSIPPGILTGPCPLSHPSSRRRSQSVSPGLLTRPCPLLPARVAVRSHDAGLCDRSSLSPARCTPLGYRLRLRLFSRGAPPRRPPARPPVHTQLFIDSAILFLSCNPAHKLGPHSRRAAAANNANIAGIYRRLVPRLFLLTGHCFNSVAKSESH